MIKNKNKNKKKITAISQIILLILSIVAISYIIGSEVGLVSGEEKTNEEKLKEAAKVILQAASKAAPSIATTPVTPSPPGIGSAGSSAIYGTSPIGGGALAPAPTTTTNFWQKSGFTWDPVWKSGSDTLWGRMSANFGALGTNLMIAAAIGFGVRALVEWIAPDKYWAEAVSKMGEAVGLGWGIGSTAAFLSNAILGTTFSLGIAGAIVGGIALIIFLFTYKEEYKETVIFNCLPWQPISGGAHCGRCGEGGLPCSKYQCMSLGQSCELVNEGTDEQACIWVNPLDTDPPEIKPWNLALRQGYVYNPTTAVSPGDKGVIVKYTPSGDGCAPHNSIISFGVELDKAARCKVSPTRERDFEQMPDILLTNGNYVYNHSIRVSVPSLEQIEAQNLTMTTDGSGMHELFVRCESKNGISNPANFVFKYCITKEPDTTAPEVVLYNPLNGFPIQSGLTEINAHIYVNEPAECRWSHSDKDYENMEGVFLCAQNLREKNALMLHECTTKLTGLLDNTENKFYIRCKDQPFLRGTAKESDRNVNKQSYVYKLIGTRPLVIDSVGPEGLVKGASDTVKVTLTARTSAGYEQGKSFCEYNEKCYREGGREDSWILFYYETPDFQYQHFQDLWLVAGTYECSIRCIDLGGNSDIKTTTYTIETDRESPMVTRIYNEAGQLKLITSESAECVYDITDCSYNFEDGISMTAYDNDLSHYTEWNTNANFYIKCKDKYGNEPPPNWCSVIVRAVENY